MLNIWIAHYFSPNLPFHVLYFEYILIGSKKYRWQFVDEWKISQYLQCSDHIALCVRNFYDVKEERLKRNKENEKSVPIHEYLMCDASMIRFTHIVPLEMVRWRPTSSNMQTEWADFVPTKSLLNLQATTRWEGENILFSPSCSSRHPL